MRPFRVSQSTTLMGRQPLEPSEQFKEEDMSTKVFVSGCFDMLHSGHVAFFREAASYGDLYVALGSDKRSLI